MQFAFSEFANWFGKSSGSKKAALSLARNVAFFEKIESWRQQVPSYPDLLEFFGAEGLRRYRKVVQWLAETSRILPDQEAKSVVTEKQRICRMLQRVPSGTWWSEALEEYARNLQVRSDNGKIKLITVRLSLTPAIGLLETVANGGDSPPGQESVDCYLSNHPGQRAALSGFLTFLSSRYHLQLQMPSVNEIPILRRVRIERQLVELSTKAQSGKDRLKWIILSLEYFHGIRGVSLRQALSLEQLHEDSGISLTFRGQNYFIPLPDRDKP